MGEEKLQHSDIVMIRPGPDSGTGITGDSGGRPAAGRRFLLRAALSVSLPPLLLVGWGWRASRETDRRQQQLQELELQVRKGREIEQQLQALQERERDLQGAAEAIRKLDSRRTLAADLLETIQQSVLRVRGVWLSRVHLDPSGLLIRGQSVQAAPVAAFLGSLQQSPLIKQVLLRSRSRDEETGIWDFELKAVASQ